MNPSSKTPPTSIPSDVHSNDRTGVVDGAPSVNKVPNTSSPPASGSTSTRAPAGAEVKPDVSDGMRLGEEARDYYPTVKSETKDDVHKSVTDIEKSSTVANCGTGTVDGESTTAASASVEPTVDDADVTMDDADMSDGDQPGPAGIARKPSAAPQVTSVLLSSLYIEINSLSE
ncbi:unnamed protein product [Haemonchus placei]|uniref:Uncharacterized protein n=1 Tax=Haemonchus placei TaxID=6290 RepID=A0A0N4VV37_HAEPC|nr:unnamed protein product [Haemonchus placei]